MLSMDLLLIYAILLACVAGFWFLYHFIESLLKIFYQYRYRFFNPLKYGFRRFIILNLPPILVVLAVNIFFLSFRVSNVEDVRKRAGGLATVNLIPLMCGTETYWLDFLGLSFRERRNLHRWIGGLVVLEAILHAVLETAFVSTFKLNTLSILGLTVPEISEFPRILLMLMSGCQRNWCHFSTSLHTAV
jgi:hypothetical protein